jgi:hypothetical protein
LNAAGRHKGQQPALGLHVAPKAACIHLHTAFADQFGDVLIKGEDSRALDSTGQTIDFLLTVKRDTAAAKRPGAIRCHPAYPAAADELKTEGGIAGRVALRQCKYAQ